MAIPGAPQSLGLQLKSERLANQHSNAAAAILIGFPSSATNESRQLRVLQMTQECSRAGPTLVWLSAI